MKQLKLILIGVICLCLTACGSLFKQTEIEYKYIKTYPPIEWLEDCEIAQPFEGMLNKDIAELARKRGESLKLCNIDKKSLRDWRESKDTNDTTN